GLTICTFSVRCQGWWLLIGLMPFDLFHELWCDFFFCLSYRSSHPQTGVHVNGGSTPKCSSGFFLWLPPFSPLCSTYVHRASVCTRLSLCFLTIPSSNCATCDAARSN